MHRARDCDAILLAKGLNRVEASSHLLWSEHRGEVPLHSGNFNLSTLMALHEASDIFTRGLRKPSLGDTGDFTNPSVLGLGWGIRRVFAKFNRSINEFDVLSKDNVLMIGKSQIRMTVIGQIDLFDLCTHFELHSDSKVPRQGRVDLKREELNDFPRMNLVEQDQEFISKSY